MHAGSNRCRDAASRTIWTLGIAGAQGRLNLRLIGVTDLHANLYPYDYFRDRPDPSVGLSKTATLIAEARIRRAIVSCSTTATFFKAPRSATTPHYP